MEKITLEKLAEMIGKGFAGQDEKFKKIDGKFDKVEADISEIKKDIKEIKTDLKDTIRRTDKLEMRADYVENVLDIPAAKK